MRTTLALGILLFSASGFANDLRDAKSMAAQLKRDPSKSYLHRNVHQRDGMAGAAISAKRDGNSNIVAVETWKKTGNTQTLTSRYFNIAGAEPVLIVTQSKLKRGRPDGSGGVDYFPAITRGQFDKKVISTNDVTGKVTTWDARGAAKGEP
jgi:hypothetical protein